jgi:flagellar protein FlaI
MKTHQNRIKGSLRSSGSEASLAIEEKVDDIIDAHAEVFRRGRTLGKNTSPKNHQDEEENAIFFFASDKKKIATDRGTEPEKKTKKHIRIGKKKKDTPVQVNSKPSIKNDPVMNGFSLWKAQKKASTSQVAKNKKRVGFGKRKEEVPTGVGGEPLIDKKSTKRGYSFWKRQKKERVTEATKNDRRIGFGKRKKGVRVTSAVKPVNGKQSMRREEQPSQFEEAIAQVKPDEATWVDQQILANTAEKGKKSPDADHSKEIKEVHPTSNKPTKEPTNWEQESPEGGRITKIPVAVPDDSFWVKKGQNNEDTPPSAFDEPGPAPDPKKIKFDEITPDGQIRFLDEAKKLKYIVLSQLGYSDETIEEIDFYPLREPFSYVEIIREKESLDKRYVLIEVQLSEEEHKCLNFIKETLGGFAFKTEELEEKGETKYINEKVDQIIDDYLLKIDTQSKKKIMFYLEKEFLGLGKLEVLMKDPNIEDISCDGSGVFIFLYHRRFGSLKSNVKFNDEDELTAFVVKLAQKCNKHISIAEPMLDATMPDGSRIQMTLSTEVTTKGSTFTIRKFSEDPFSPPDLIEFNTMSSEMVAYMWLAVENGVNALIAGGTAAGKTSTMNAISLFIPRESKIVSIEETREINLPHPNWIPGVVRSGFGEVVGNKVIGEIDLYDLMKAALRQRPEYILVGEIRGKEAYVLFQAMATGHTTYSTVHADSAQSLIHRLEGKPIEIPRIMLQALDIVCIQVISRVKDKRARRCKQIIEIIDIDPTTKEILTNEVFRWDPIEDKFVYSGKSYILERIRAEKDISREEMISEIKNRAGLLEWMNKNNIREFKKVATVVAQYVDNPAEVIKKIKIEAA